MPTNPPATAVPGSPGRPPLPVAAWSKKPKNTVLAKKALKTLDNRSDSKRSMSLAAAKCSAGVLVVALTHASNATRAAVLALREPVASCGGALR